MRLGRLPKRAILFGLMIIMAVGGTNSAMASNANTQADALKEAGLFLGGTTGYNLDGKLTRVQGLMLALRVQGLEPEVNALSAVEEAVTLSKVQDAADIPEWARKAVAYAITQSPAITTGVQILSDGRVIFAPNRDMSGAEFITFLARGMGYEATLASSVDTAVSSNMLTPSQVASYASLNPLLREQAVDMMYTAVKNGVLAQTNEQLIDSLVRRALVSIPAAKNFGYQEAAETPVSPALFYVESVQALNCKQIAVHFSDLVDGESLMASNYLVRSEGTASHAVIPSVGAEGKTVILTLDGNAAFANASTVQVTIRKSVKSEAGISLASDYVNASVMVADGKLPELVSVKAVGNRTIQLQYDEPVWNGSGTSLIPANFTVKSGIYTHAITSATANPNESTIQLQLGTVMQPGQVNVKSNANGMIAGSVTDFAGYFSLPKEMTMVYAPDTTPVQGTLESVNRVTRKVVLKFSRPLFGGNVTLYQMVSGVDVFSSNPVTKSESAASDTWEFTMKNPIPTGTVDFFLVGSTNTGERLSDLYGQPVQNKSFTFSVAADTTPPGVSSLSVIGNQSVEILFNEEVDQVEANRLVNYEIKDSAGVVQTITGVQLQPDQRTVRLSVSLKDMETYVFKVMSAKDIAGNVMTVTYSATRAMTDVLNPKVVLAYAVPAQRQIVIHFSEPMNDNDLKERTNYLVDRDGGTDQFQPLGTGDVLSVLDSSRVMITMAQSITTPSVKMAALRDLSGKRLGSDTSFEYTGENGNLLNIGQETVTLDMVSMVDRNILLLTFNTRISAMNPEDFKLRNRVNGGAFVQPVQSMQILGYGETLSGGTEVLLKLSRSLNADTTYTDSSGTYSVEMQVQPGGTFGASLAPITARTHANALPLLDAYGGGIATDASGNRMITWRDFNNDGKLDTVVVLYEEPILPSSLSSVHFSVAGYSVTGVSLDSDGFVSAGSNGDGAAGARYVILNITKANQGMDAGTQPAVTQLYPLQDLAGNFIN